VHLLVKELKLIAKMHGEHDIKLIFRIYFLNLLNCILYTFYKFAA
jgi:hypothetical protein